jgi:trans-2,3-dihydro-3-hydroxyanthranilate isomerase
MRSYPFMQVDAFTTTRLTGNACAILFDADDLDDTTMLTIAREMNLAETAFVVRSRKADFGARYFTPKTEIPLAGHPTIATVFALAETGRLRLAGEVTTITLELTAGIIEVELLAPGGIVERVTMSQLKPQFLEHYGAEEILPCLGLAESDLVSGLPLQVVSTGTPQLMIPVKDTGCLDRIRPDVIALEAFKGPKGISSVHIFCVVESAPRVRILARNFDTPPDLIEDPFTGSAMGGMGCYLWHYGVIPDPTFEAEQGLWLERPGLAYGEVIGPPEDIVTVRIGGSAVTVIEGMVTI